MNDIAIAASIHVLAIVWWIGGVAMVTTVVLPTARRSGDAAEGLAMFRRIESRFAWHARAAVLLAGASGLYMAAGLGLWPQFLTRQFWWLGAMAFVWFVFAFVLFIGEPLFFERWLDRRAREAPGPALALLQRLHVAALAASIVTILGAAAGSRGFVF